MAQSFAAGEATSGSAGSGTPDGSSDGAEVALQAAVVDRESVEVALALDSAVVQLCVEVCHVAHPAIVPTS